MPRLNPSRAITSEINLARRIAIERKRRGLSYESLARRLTDIGCPIQGSAIYRIEKGSPPRRVTVEELIAFSKAFGASIDDLLTPVDLIEQREANQLILDMAAVREAFKDTVDRLVDVWQRYMEYYRHAAQDDNMSEILEYVEHQLESGGHPGLSAGQSYDSYSAGEGESFAGSLRDAMQKVIVVTQAIGAVRANPDLNPGA